MQVIGNMSDLEQCGSSIRYTEKVPWFGLYWELETCFSPDRLLGMTWSKLTWITRAESECPPSNLNSVHGSANTPALYQGGFFFSQPSCPNTQKKKVLMESWRKTHPAGLAFAQWRPPWGPAATLRHWQLQIFPMTSSSETQNRACTPWECLLDLFYQCNRSKRGSKSLTPLKKLLSYFIFFTNSSESRTGEGRTTHKTWMVIVIKLILHSRCS